MRHTSISVLPDPAPARICSTPSSGRTVMMLRREPCGSRGSRPTWEHLVDHVEEHVGGEESAGRAGCLGRPGHAHSPRVHDLSGSFTFGRLGSWSLLSSMVHAQDTGGGGAAGRFQSRAHA